MRAIAEIRTADLNNDSQRPVVDATHAILEREGLSPRSHAMGTEVSGEIGVVLEAVEHIHTQLHAAGHGRLSTTVTIETRSDETPTLER